MELELSLLPWEPVSCETLVNNFAHLEQVHEFTLDAVDMAVAMALLGEGDKCGL